jgi:hypothetical protein
MQSGPRSILAKWFLLAAMVASFAPCNAAADEPVEAPLPPPAIATAADVKTLAAEIDRHVAARWAADNVTPAERVDDAGFLRRVSLDIAGRIPTVSEVREFLADGAPDKRRRAVDRLLAGNGYVNHFTTYWRRVMLPEANTSFQTRYVVPGFEAWLRAQLKKNAGYDDLVRDVITVPMTGAGNIYSFQNGGALTPLAFFQAKQNKPEEVGAATARIFLGVRLECAQCHDHPFDAWQREQFWSFAAFYAPVKPQLQRQGGVVGLLTGLFGGNKAPPKGLRIPDTDTYVTAAFLDNGEQVGSGDARQTLAVWMVSPQNPYFARTLVNRMWAHLFGIGLVDPVDDFGESNQPSHPQLLDELARDFAAHNFDLKYLIRAITASRTYQLSSSVGHPSQTDNPRLFARMAVKGLSSEQLFDSLAQATGYREPNRNRSPFAFNVGTPRGKFLELFNSDNDKPVERETTILQALVMMNGQLVANATHLSRSRTLAAVADYPLMTTAERIEARYFAALSRPPRAEESVRLVKYVESHAKTPDRSRALGDVFWALLNSSEFMLNH